jgi:hypothetical protein
MVVIFAPSHDRSRGRDSYSDCQRLPKNGNWLAKTALPNAITQCYLIAGLSLPKIIPFCQSSSQSRTERQKFSPDFTLRGGDISG